MPGGDFQDPLEWSGQEMMVARARIITGDGDGKGRRDLRSVLEGESTSPGDWLNVSVWEREMSG